MAGNWLARRARRLGRARSAAAPARPVPPAPVETPKPPQPPRAPTRPQHVPERVRDQIGWQYLGRPSYHYRLHALRRVQSYTWSDELYFEDANLVMNKLQSYAFARRHGARPPQLFGYWPDLAAIPWPDLPERFVLKAARGTSARGVFPLVREGEGVWRDLSSGTTMDVDGLAAQMTQAGFVDCSFFAEALLEAAHGGGLPQDWKLYCFRGRVGMAMVRDVNGSRNPKDFTFRYFDADWADLGQANLDARVDPSLPRPQHPQELLETAERLSTAVPRAHVRVDLYDTPDGVVFGELTLCPGGRHRLRRDVDRRLGELWERADANLLASVGRAGGLDMVFQPESDAAMSLLAGR